MMSKATLKRLEALERRQETAENPPEWAIVIVDADGNPLTPVADGVKLRILIPDNGRQDATVGQSQQPAEHRRSLA